MATPEPHHEIAENLPNKWLVLASVMIGTFMSVLDSTIVSVAFPKMMAVFGVSVDQIEWLMTAYLLAFAVILPSSGWIADHFGYKKSYMFGLVLFTIGSALCSMAWSENILIAFRVIQGAGAGLIMPIGMAIVTRTFPARQRGTALGFWGIAAAASVSLGPLFGGYLVDYLDWHAIFDINIPVGIIGLIAVWIIQTEYKDDQIKKFDLWGFITMTIALVTLLLALATGNSSWNTEGWHSTFIVSCFFISALSFVLFFTIENYVEHPLVNLRLLRNYNYGMSTFIMFLFGIAFFGNAFLLPIFLQNSLGYTALQAGMVFFPVGILQAFVAPMAGQLTDRLNPKIPALIGIIILGYSMYSFSFFSLETTRYQVMFPMYLRGLGMGLVFTPLSTIALLNIPRPQMAQASGLFNTIRQIGGSFGIAALGTMLTQRIKFHNQIYGAQLDSSSPAFKEVVNHLQNFAVHTAGSTQADAAMQAKSLLTQHVVSQAFVQGINDDFLIGAMLTFFLVIPLMLLKTKKEHLNR